MNERMVLNKNGIIPAPALTWRLTKQMMLKSQTVFKKSKRTNFLTILIQLQLVKSSKFSRNGISSAKTYLTSARNSVITNRKYIKISIRFSIGCWSGWSSGNNLIRMRSIWAASASNWSQTVASLWTWYLKRISRSYLSFTIRMIWSRMLELRSVKHSWRLRRTSGWGKYFWDRNICKFSCKIVWKSLRNNITQTLVYSNFPKLQF